MSTLNDNHYQNRIEDIQLVMMYIEDHFDKDIPLSEAADLLHLSVSQFSIVFNKFTGHTFKKYLNYYRIEKVCQLLLDEEIPIIDISYRCGFSNLRTFNRVFKEITKTTPSKYRKYSASNGVRLQQHYVTSSDLIISTEESQTKIEY